MPKNTVFTAHWIVKLNASAKFKDWEDENETTGLI